MEEQLTDPQEDRDTTETHGRGILDYIHATSEPAQITGTVTLSDIEQMLEIMDRAHEEPVVWYNTFYDPVAPAFSEEEVKDLLAEEVTW